FIAVTDQELTEDEVTRLTTLHERLFRLPSEWAKHLEGSYFSREQLRSEPGTPVWFLNHGSTQLERSDHCNTLVVRWILSHLGVPLLGPPIGTLIDPVDSDALRAESRQTLLDWGAEILQDRGAYNNRFYQGLIVFTLCRVLHTVETGQVHSKRASAEWMKHWLRSEAAGPVLSRASHVTGATVGGEEVGELIDRAWTTRPDPYTSSRTPADAADFSLTLALVEAVTDHLRTVKDQK
ncbi:MAG TPA: aminoglycoside adenylyltransferase domain-containing protein, partial [Fimbriimonadaceae bacterium]|nr:aminoglycoside adenylyltransferase domain-containing protein [Fimbriimonadaceae bacterium]